MWWTARTGGVKQGSVSLVPRHAMRTTESKYLAVFLLFPFNSENYESSSQKGDKKAENRIKALNWEIH